MGNKSIAHRL